MEEYFRKKYGEDSPLYPFAASSLAQYYSSWRWNRTVITGPSEAMNWKGADGLTDRKPLQTNGICLANALESYAESDKAWECYRYAIRGSYEKGKPTETTVAIYVAGSIQR